MSKALDIEPPSIPVEHITFARGVAKLADESGIDRLEIKYRPTFRGHLVVDRRIRGDLRVIYSSVDGRGRPCRNLSIQLDAALVIEVEKNPESSS